MKEATYRPTFNRAKTSNESSMEMLLGRAEIRTLFLQEQCHMEQYNGNEG